MPCQIIGPLEPCTVAHLGRFLYLCQRERIFLPPTSTWTYGGACGTLPLPRWMLRGPPFSPLPRGSGYPLPSRVAGLPCCGHGRHECGYRPQRRTSSNSCLTSALVFLLRREAERDRPRTRDRGRFPSSWRHRPTLAAGARPRIQGSRLNVGRPPSQRGECHRRLG